MALTRKVNGKEIALTAQQEAAQIAEWAQERAIQNQPPAHTFVPGRNEDVIIRWMAQLNSITYNQARTALDDIWDALP